MAKEINDQTIIQFNLKWFFGLLISFLTVLWGYHTYILGPTVSEVKETSKVLQESVKNLEIQVKIQEELNKRRTHEIDISDLDTSN